MTEKRKTYGFGCKLVDARAGMGFSLVEVNLAVLMVAVGLLSLFTLFPLALREGENAVTDLHEAMFADYVLSGLSGNALSITNWTTWKNLASFQSAVANGIYPLSDYGWEKTGVGEGVDFPQVNPPNPQAVVRKMRYQLNLEDIPNTKGRRKCAILQVRSGDYGDFGDRIPRVFYTEFVYTGM